MNNMAVDKELMKAIAKYAEKLGWYILEQDSHTGRVRIEDQFQIYKADIYVSKMSVGITQKGQPTIWKKGVAKEKLKQFLREPIDLITD